MMSFPVISADVHNNCRYFGNCRIQPYTSWRNHPQNAYRTNRNVTPWTHPVSLSTSWSTVWRNLFTTCLVRMWKRDGLMRTFLSHIRHGNSRWNSMGSGWKCWVVASLNRKFWNKVGRFPIKRFFWVLREKNPNLSLSWRKLISA